jgi:thymidylate synthase (FAD)
VDSEPEFYIPDSLRARAENVKQGSSEEVIGQARDIVTIATANSLREYNLLLSAGVCPEQARIVLPHNLMTEWIWSGTLKAFHKMLVLRLDPHAQYETRIVAQKILPLIEERFPVSIKALMENN